VGHFGSDSPVSHFLQQSTPGHSSDQPSGRHADIPTSDPHGHSIPYGYNGAGAVKHSDGYGGTYGARSTYGHADAG